MFTVPEDDLSWYESFAPEEGVVGTWEGPNSSYNIRNAQPGFRYYHSRFNENDIMRFIEQGWVPLTDEDPERCGLDLLPADLARKLDTLKAYKGTICMKIREEDYAARQAQLETIRRAKFDGITVAFQNQGEERYAGVRRSAPPLGSGRPQ